jgi:fructose-bisphosphate aldolase class I
MEELKSVAAAIVAKQKGVLAADESNPTIKKRFDAIQLESTEENRRRYRELLFTAEGIERYISGVILFDETLRQSSAGGIPFARLLSRRGIIPGIKVDKGAKPLALYPGNKVTEGLDGLRDRLAEYKQLGARFAKWRAVIQIDERELPAPYAIRANVHALARYAALCQEAGIVPMVEPEVLMDGDHDIEVCYDVTEATLRSLFGALYEQNVMLEGTILKASMVISGKGCAEQADVDEVAEATVRCLKASVPAAIPGIVFLSGGQSDEQATAHLNAMNQIGPHPWPLSFSYGRAMQSAALKLWAKDMAKNFAEAQKTVSMRAKENGLAALGQWQKAA